MNIGQRIRELREAREMTQAELASAAGRTQEHISRIETGASVNPTTKTLTKLAAALGVSLNELLKEE